MANENGYEYHDLKDHRRSYRKVFRVDGIKYMTKFHKETDVISAKDAMRNAEAEYLDIVIALRDKGKVTPKIKAAAKALKLKTAIKIYIDEVGKFKKGYKEESSKFTQIKNAIGDMAFVEITDDDIAHFRDEEKKRVAESTVRQYMSLISVVYEFYIDKKRSEVPHLKNPTRGVKRPDPSKWSDRIFKGKERERLFEAAKKYRLSHLMYPCILFALATTMRRGEIDKINWEDINFDKKYIIVEDTKNSENRRVPLTSAARNALNMLKDGLEREKVFKGLSAGMITDCFKEICIAAKIESLKFHNLRHIALTDLADAGLTAIELQRFSGHKTLSQLSRYVHANSVKLADKADRLLAEQ